MKSDNHISVKSTWSKEMISDLSINYGIDAVDNLERALVREIIRENRKNKINKIYKSQKHI
jgi:hypothetical protein